MITSILLPPLILSCYFITIKVYSLYLQAHRFLRSMIVTISVTWSCTCDNPCSDAKYGRTVHLVMPFAPKNPLVK